MYLEESIQLINGKLTVLNEKQNIVIWGAAENTVKLFQYTDISEYIVQAIVDNGKCGTKFMGKTVLSADKIIWDNDF